MKESSMRELFMMRQTREQPLPCALQAVQYVVLVLVVFFVGPTGAKEMLVQSPAGANLPSRATHPEIQTMKIRLTTNGKSTTATLIDSPTTREFVALLPMTLKLDDYASTEKVAYLPEKLTTQSAPAGIDPDVGDIAYYAPWGNLAIFYRDFGYATGLVKLGRFDSGIEAFQVRGALEVTIEVVSK
jgi:hypothetical protein